MRFRVEGDDMPTVGLGVLVTVDQKHPLTFFLARLLLETAVTSGATLSPYRYLYAK